MPRLLRHGIIKLRFILTTKDEIKLNLKRMKRYLKHQSSSSSSRPLMICHHDNQTQTIASWDRVVSKDNQPDTLRKHNKPTSK